MNVILVCLYFLGIKQACVSSATRHVSLLRGSSTEQRRATVWVVFGRRAQVSWCQLSVHIMLTYIVFTRVSLHRQRQFVWRPLSLLHPRCRRSGRLASSAGWTYEFYLNYLPQTQPRRLPWRGIPCWRHSFRVGRLWDRNCVHRQVVQGCSSDLLFLLGTTMFHLVVFRCRKSQVLQAFLGVEYLRTNMDPLQKFITNPKTWTYM